MQGGLPRDWETRRGQGEADEQLLRAAVRAFPPRSAEALVGFDVEQLIPGPMLEHVGRCPKPDERARGKSLADGCALGREALKPQHLKLQKRFTV